MSFLMKICTRTVLPPAFPDLRLKPEAIKSITAKRLNHNGPKRRFGNRRTQSSPFDFAQGPDPCLFIVSSQSSPSSPSSPSSQSSQSSPPPFYLITIHNIPRRASDFCKVGANRPHQSNHQLFQVPRYRQDSHKSGCQGYFARHPG